MNENHQAQAQSAQQYMKIHTQFAIWLRTKVELPQYLSLFEVNEIDDIRYLSSLCDHSKLSEIGIKNSIHRDLLIREMKSFIEERREFETWLKTSVGSPYKDFLRLFERNGIHCKHELIGNIQTRQDLNDLVMMNWGGNGGGQGEDGMAGHSANVSVSSMDSGIIGSIVSKIHPKYVGKCLFFTLLCCGEER